MHKHMQHSVCNFTLCILRRVSKFLAESFDILLMGDMFFDENLVGGGKNLKYRDIYLPLY